MTYSYPDHVPFVPAGIAVALVVWGGIDVLRARRRNDGPLLYFGILCFAVAALMGGVVAPGMALDRVVLTDTSLQQIGGLWFQPVKGFEFDQVASIRVTTARNREEVWVIEYKDGATHTLDPGDLWEQNGADIIMRLRARGIAVAVDSTLPRT